MMRITVLAAAALIVAGAARAQTAHTSPDQIICAMSGSCSDTAAAPDQRIPIGQEKSFSLVRPDAGRAAAAVAPAPGAPSAAAPVRHASLAPSRRGVRAARPNSGRIDMLVSFPNGSADLTPAGRDEVRSFAAAMASPSLAGMRFNVEGHTDAVGNRAYNLDLSRRRAQTVVDYLVGLGADKSRLESAGYGFDKPRAGLAPRNPANRRVEFVKAG